jgi:hypothetical protein
LADQRDLVAAQQPQLVRERVLRAEHAPGVPVGAQRVGEAERVEPVVLGARRGLAVAVPLGGLGVQREDAQLRLQQPLDRRAGAGLDREADHGRRAVVGVEFRQSLAQVGPSLGRVRDPQLQHDRAGGVDHAHVVVPPRPIHRAVVREGGVRLGRLRRRRRRRRRRGSGGRVHGSS